MNIPDSIRRPALMAVVAAAVFVLGYRDGSYGPLQRSEAAAVACLAVCGLVAGGMRLYRPRPFVVLGGLLAAFTAWTALSVTWTTSADDAVPEVILLGLYLAVFAVVAFTARSRALAVWCDGMAVGVGVIGGVALLSRFFPGLFDAARPNVELLFGSASRLSFPVGYWNGLGILLACCVPLLLRAAVAERGGVARKALAVGFLPAVGTIVYLASSRGAALTAAVAVVVYLGFSGSRWAVAAGATLLGCAGTAAAVAVVTREPALVDRPLSDAAADAGPWAFAALVVVCACTGAAFVALDRVGLGAWRPSRRVTTVIAAASALVVVAGLLAADLPARVEAFTASPLSTGATEGTIRSHFLSGGSTGRWQLWASAVDQFESDPLHGGGAGSFESWWAKHGTLPVFVRNAHSLYLETLGELGIVGLVILGGFVLGGLCLGAWVVMLTSATSRYQPAAPVAVFAAFAVAAAFDWIWQLPALGVVAIACVAMITGAASERRSAASPRGPRAAGVVAAAAMIVAVPLLGLALLHATTELRLELSANASVRGDGTAAVAEAQAARALEPWSASPLLRLALAEERFGSLRVARAAIDEAVRKDPQDWRLRVIAARLQAKVGDVAAAARSLATARSLNPRSPLFAASG
jgi:hypothetical protein